MSLSKSSASLVLQYSDSEDDSNESNANQKQNDSSNDLQEKVSDDKMENHATLSNSKCDLSIPGLAEVLMKIESIVTNEKGPIRELESLTIYKSDPDMYDRVIAADLRGKTFKVSNNGRCPKCNNKKNAFVILDFLFPMGDMPEICNYLIAKGEAVLWSSQNDSHCKDPPTLLCRGKCPADPAKCGFNLNWQKTNLEKIFLFPEEEEPEKKQQAEPAKPFFGRKNKIVTLPASLLNKKPASEKLEETLSDDDIENPFDDGQVDLVYYKQNVSWVVLDEIREPGEESADDERLIKTMIALSDAKKDWKEGKAKLWSDDEEEKGEQDMEICETKKTKSAFAFSWESYSANPWAPVQGTKKKLNYKQVDDEKSKKMLPNDEVLPTSVEESSLVDDNVIMDATDVKDGASVEDTVGASSSGVATSECVKDETAVPQGEESLEDAKHENVQSESSADAHDASSGVSQSQAEEADKKTSDLDNINKTDNEPKKKYTAADFPVSKDGSCPYCKSTNVLYIVVSNKARNMKLPAILQKLLKYHFAYKMAKKDDSEPPSFQCLSCTYGFNLDWRTTNLEKMYKKKIEDAEKEAQKSHDQTSYNLSSQPPPGPMPQFPPPPPMPMAPPMMGFPPFGYPGFGPPRFPNPPMMGFDDWGSGFMPPPGMPPPGMPPPGMPPFPMPRSPMPMRPPFGPDMNAPGWMDGPAWMNGPFRPRFDSMWRPRTRMNPNRSGEKLKKHPGKYRTEHIPLTSSYTSSSDVPGKGISGKNEKATESGDNSVMKREDTQPLPPGEVTGDADVDTEEHAAESEPMDYNIVVPGIKTELLSENMEVKPQSQTSIANAGDSTARNDVDAPNVTPHREITTAGIEDANTVDVGKAVEIDVKIEPESETTEETELSSESKRVKVEEPDTQIEAEETETSEVNKDNVDDTPKSKTTKRGRGRGRGRARGRGRGTRGRKSKAS